MSNKVYLLGAGVNQSIRQANSKKECYSPPMISNFFQVLFGIDFPQKDLNKYYDGEFCKEFNEYILKYWKMDKQQLINNGLDLEEIYTIMQLQREEAKRNNDTDAMDRLEQVFISLNMLFISTINNFKSSLRSSESCLKLGQILYKEKPTIITFNYDDFIERAIAFAQPDWDKALAYGFKFNEITVKNRFPKVINQDDYYFNKHLYEWKILKLHGSINWWEFSDNPIDFGSMPYEKKTRELYDKKKDAILLKDVYVDYVLRFFSAGGLQIGPVIVAPFLHKTFHFNKVHERVFKSIWDQARNTLEKCESLIIIGYSFPLTDFHTKKLFLEAFSKNGNIKEIIVVNPDSKVKDRVKEICHFEQVKGYNYLEEYLKLFGCE